MASLKVRQGYIMDEDFEAPTFSQSEDSEGDGTEDDEADMDLESKMGENADGKQVADEKLWDKENDGELDNQDEKYESGPSVQESDTSCRELRAKDDNALAADDELGQMKSYEYSAQGEASAEPQGDNMRHVMPLSNSNDMSNSITPTRCLPSDEIPVMDISMSDTRNGSLAPNQLQHDISQGEPSSLQRAPANPYRNLGDAMVEWKEKVTVLDDPQEHQQSAEIVGSSQQRLLAAVSRDCWCLWS